MPRSAPGDRAEQQAGEARDGDRAGQREQRRQPEPAADATPGHRVATGEIAVAVGADRDEERVPERELAGHADQQGQADRPDRRRHREQPGLQPEALEVERRHGDHDRRQDGGSDALRHGSPPAEPKSPAGRTSSTSSITA